MTHQIRTVKPETRILGIDACRDGAIVGAIVRGGLYLDGILNFQGTITGKVSEQIQQSRYYPELRVIMLHDSKGRLNIGQLWKTTGLPVIAITKTRLRLRHNYTFEKKNKIIYASSQLNPETIKQVIHLSWTIDDLPEPVRIAHLLVNSISSRPFSR